MKKAEIRLRREKERQDAEGISRKRIKSGLTVNSLMFIKISMAVAIIFFYFVYSPALIFLLGIYVLLYFVTVRTERATNKSYLKRNRLKIHKFDHALAFIILIVAIIVPLVHTGTSSNGALGDVEESQIKRYVSKGDIEGAMNFASKQSSRKTLINIFTLMTGERTVMSGGGGRNFGMEKAPPNFKPPNMGEFKGDFDGKFDGNFKFDGEKFSNGYRPQLPDNFDFEGFRKDKFKGKRFDFGVKDVPVYYLFSSLLSTVASIALFLIPVSIIASIIFMQMRKKALDKNMFVPIVVSTSMDVFDEKLDKILDFEC